jgi:cytochrome c556
MLRTMHVNVKIAFAALSTAVLLAGCGSEPQDERPGQPVKTRQTAFKEILRSFEPMGVMLRENRYNADKFLALANEVAVKRDAPWNHFGPDTNYPPTKATAAVWEQPERFERDRAAFFSAVDALVVAAQTKDRKQVEAPYRAVHDACQECHRTFKKR